MDSWTMLVVLFFVILTVTLLVAAFFSDAPSDGDRALAAIDGADALIAEIEETDELIRRARLVLAKGLVGHAVAAITITEVAEQLGDAAANLEAARRRVPAWEMEASRG